MSEHSPEPWVVVQGNGKEGLVRLTDAAGFFLDNTRIHPNGDTERGMEPEDARRIVACINFCREFPTEFLEKHQMHQMADIRVSVDMNEEWRTLAAIQGFAGLVVIKESA